MVVAMAGRAAEILLYEPNALLNDGFNFTTNDLVVPGEDGPIDVTFGSSGDVRRAMELATQYINVFGAGDGVGAGAMREEQSELSRGKIDQRIAELIGAAQKTAITILRGKKEELKLFSQLLLEEKTVSGKKVP